MKAIKKALVLETSDYYELHLAIINPLLPTKNRLTPMEIRIIACFLSSPAQPPYPSPIINSTSRKYALSYLNLSDAGLSNHLRSLRFKDIITDNQILPILIPHPSTQLYTFKLTNYGNKLQ